MDRRAPLRILAAVYRADGVLPYRWKRRIKEAVYDRFGFLLAHTTSYRLYRQHQGRPLAADADPDPAAADARHLAQQRMLFEQQAAQRFAVFLASGATLQFGAPPAPGGPRLPRCSVVVVLHQQAPLSFVCLEALARQLGVDLQLIVVDNASTDRTDELLSRLRGAVTILRNRENLHFLRACNQAFARVTADAEAVALVNNDAVADPLALERALACLRRFPRAGAVAGRILHVDGRLQEAGSVVFADGTCLGVGRRSSPDHPLLNVRRPIDYGSGCLLVLRAAALAEMEGFDPAFAPAYYEETDLCLRLQDRGWSVLYEPACIARHVEFASSGGSFEAVRPLMEKHRLLLRERHRARLARHCVPAEFRWHDPAWLLAHHRLPVRVLWIDDSRPERGRGGGFPRLEEIVTTLADRGHWVTVFATNGSGGPADQWASADYELQVGGADELRGLLKHRRGFYTHVCASRHHNISLLGQLEAEGCLGRRGAPDRPLLMADVESLFSIRDHSRTWLARQGRALERVIPEEVPGLREELGSLEGFDRVLAVSPTERELIRGHGVSACWAVGHALPPAPRRSSFASSRGVLFLGAIQDEHSPNLDSLRWLVDALLPALFSLPAGADLPVTIAGHHSPHLVADAYRALQERFPTVRCLGFQHDLSGLMAAHRVFLAPTRVAAGLPHKVHQAVAHGLPVVTTPLIADQMGWQPGRDLLTGADPHALAAAVVRLHGEEGLWQAVRDASLQRLAEECDRERQALILEEAFAPFPDPADTVGERAVG